MPFVTVIDLDPIVVEHQFAVGDEIFAAPTVGNRLHGVWRVAEIVQAARGSTDGAYLLEPVDAIAKCEVMRWNYNFQATKVKLYVNVVDKICVLSPPGFYAGAG